MTWHLTSCSPPSGQRPPAFAPTAVWQWFHKANPRWVVFSSRNSLYYQWHFLLCQDCCGMEPSPQLFMKGEKFIGGTIGCSCVRLAQNNYIQWPDFPALLRLLLNLLGHEKSDLISPLHHLFLLFYDAREAVNKLSAWRKVRGSLPRFRKGHEHVSVRHSVQVYYVLLYNNITNKYLCGVNKSLCSWRKAYRA